MNAPNPPVIAFELGVGEFRIVTPEAVYQIKVCPDLVEAIRLNDAEIAHEDHIPMDSGHGFYKELSEELFDKVGQLARQLSVSVENLPGQLSPHDLGATDQKLENAKGQLEEIVKITEQASMTIMDTADHIQSDMEQLKNQLNVLQQLNLMTANEPLPNEQILDQAPLSPENISETINPETLSPETLSPEHAPASKSSLPDFLDKLAQLSNLINNFEMPKGTSGPESSPLAVTPPPALDSLTMVETTEFNVDVVFQTLYELCTNESVKDHIKLMRENRSEAFNEIEIAEKLSELSVNVENEDGFFNFPIPAILKTLYGAASSDDYKATLKKMNQTAASIFLDSVLPIEGEIKEIAVPTEVPPPAPNLNVETPMAEQSASEAIALAPNFQLAKELIYALEQSAANLAPTAIDPAPKKLPPLTADSPYTTILKQDQNTIIETVTLTHTLIQQTETHLTRILESLSFQDLSGQRIMKVVSLIGDIQKQLLAILISFDTKIKVHLENTVEEIEPEQANKMAQDEVDKAMEKVSVHPSELLGPGAESSLDQGAVNDLLAQLGF
ncbi:MAG: protein phosphatase CheZ [Candidatus Adiutrix sp.]